ncbi:CD82 antigen-like isoform X1 [Nerophis ophidion]|uniref:CD82 antigen-like isoform X1 n=1 Tax=Nerophis ophidion TaxID=159077 RepID=UPI002ADFB05B|nr:CD82 antigen-like isoform X1 [Nerophis ophidion]
MKSEVKVELVKFIFLVMNFFILAVGTSVAACGVWILFDSTSFIGVVSSSVGLQMVGAGLLLIGGLAMASSMMGCLGARWEKRPLLLAYVCILLLLLLGQLLLLLLLLLYKHSIEEHADTLVNDIIHQYDGAGYQDRLLDDLQRHGACCGLTSPSDWLQNSFIQTLNASATHVLPCSCFSSHQSTSPFPSPWCTRVDVLRDFGLGNHTHTQGCRGKLGDWLQENTVTVVAMDVTLMLTQVLQLALAASLYLAFGQKTTDGMAAIDPAHHNLEPS